MTASSRPFMTKFTPICSSKGRWVIPRKQRNEYGNEAVVEKEKVEPIVAFSKPPPLPPVLGPLVALSMLESWDKRDNNDE